MSPQDFESRIVAWAKGHRGLHALVLIGSRAQDLAPVDEWSDWDFQMIVPSVEPFLNRSWPDMILKCWSAHFERTERMVTKVSAVFEGGYEADFVLLPSWQMRLVFFAMRYPRARQILPNALRSGIENQRLVAGRGYRVLVGDKSWDRRYGALALPWPARACQEADFEFHCAGFWRHAAWTAKKLIRGELRAAARWYNVEMRDHLWALLEMDAELDGRTWRPEARQAESWLNPDILRQTGIPVAPDRVVLSKALLGDMDLFRQVCISVARRRGFQSQNHDELYAWLCANLKPFAADTHN